MSDFQPVEGMVMVPANTLNKFVSRLVQVEQQLSSLVSGKGTNANMDIKDRAMLLSKGGTLTGTDVCKLCSWSKSTLYRRLNAGEILMVKDGRDFRIDVNEFLTWHAENF